MLKKDRNLTVYLGSYQTTYSFAKVVPKIILQGKWLEELGYSIGKKITVRTVNKNNETKIIVSLVN